MRFLRLVVFFVFALLLSSLNIMAQARVIQIPNARSVCSPSIAIMNGILFASWRGTASLDGSTDDQQLYLSWFHDGEWRTPTLLPGRSMFGPSLAVSANRLFISWHGPGNVFTGTGDSQTHFGYYEHGQGFKLLGVIPEARSAGPPGMAVYKGLLYSGWRADGNVTVGTVPGNQHWILYGTFDPLSETWSIEDEGAVNIVHANSTSGPSFASVGDKLYALWRGTGSLTLLGPNSDPGDPLIYYAWFDGASWSARNLPLPTVPSANTAWGASATEWDGKLCIGWRGDQPWDGAEGDQSIYFASLDEFGRWEPLDCFDELNLESAFGPSMASDPEGEELWVAWRGIFDSQQGIDDQGLYLARFRRTKTDLNATKF